ncbi:putative mitochondrial protein [Dendrobium catenatum]|uniref:Putative mitochondrial protein n=1 Tax=Dendrobium catenatum TaxID=906689 RepID=A0A2I0X6X0_9ASPA|nr:putative mitochondrial protein [Dendrobium catenatum]
MGPKYTWCNNKNGGGRILERLDRCLINSMALIHLQTTVLKHLARIASDDCPISIKILANKVSKKKEFTFEDIWLTYKASQQGCPLSPFMFIMCSQLLTEEFGNIGKNIGIKINPNASIISHLMYADDILIFSKANKICLKKVNKILKNYCSWTGQKINYKKSAVLFSKLMKRRECKGLIKVLNINMVKEMEYLGVKIALRRLVKSDFYKIIVKTAAKINI